MKDFTLGLALKQRRKATRKSSVKKRINENDERWCISLSVSYRLYVCQGYVSDDGDIPEGTMVQVYWKEDKKTYRARVSGRRICITYQVQQTAGMFDILILVRLMPPNVTASAWMLLMRQFRGRLNLKTNRG